MHGIIDNKKNGSCAKHWKMLVQVREYSSYRQVISPALGSTMGSMDREEGNATHRPQSCVVSGEFKKAVLRVPSEP
jgi:hypothetical protein